MFQAQLIKDFHLDNYLEGETDSKYNYTDFLIYGKFQGKTINELLANIENFIDVDRQDLYINDEDNYYQCQYSIMEDKDGIKADKQEIESWKQGKINLFIADYFFNIEVVKNLSYSELLQLTEDEKYITFCNKFDFPVELFKSCIQDLEKIDLSLFEKYFKTVKSKNLVKEYNRLINQGNEYIRRMHNQKKYILMVKTEKLKLLKEFSSIILKSINK